MASVDVLVKAGTGACTDRLSVCPRLVAVALLYLEQEDAFWCLVTIVEVFMPRDYYTKTLLGSQVCLGHCLIDLELSCDLS